jgi:MerR family transcriptional regulator, redox-sensitive transcriptional activator SoxR
MNSKDELTIGEVAARSGLAPSALRFYEAAGLITSRRSSGNQRRYHRSVLRRLAVITAAQRVGLSLADIGSAFGHLPPDRAPTKAQWARMSARWRRLLDARITDLQQVRDNLASCIGCGCLSMRQCALYNPQDSLAASGAGAGRLFPRLDRDNRPTR